MDEYIEYETLYDTVMSNGDKYYLVEVSVATMGFHETFRILSENSTYEECLKDREKYPHPYYDWYKLRIYHKEIKTVVDCDSKCID